MFLLKKTPKQPQDPAKSHKAQEPDVEWIDDYRAQSIHHHII